MSDYGRPLQFGYFLTPDASNYPELLRVAQLVDDLGPDLIGIQDHPYYGKVLNKSLKSVALAASPKSGLTPNTSWRVRSSEL